MTLPFNSADGCTLVTLSVVGFSPPIGINRKASIFGPCGVSLQLNFSSGSGVGTASIQYSNDPTSLSSPSTAVWNNHEQANGITNTAGDTNLNLAVPVFAVRLAVSAYTSGSIALGVGHMSQ